MKNLTEYLSQYAAYHRDRRNIGTHFIGIPMITFSVVALLARPHVAVGGLPLSLGVVVTLGALVFYLALDVRYGLAMTLLMGLWLSVAGWLAAQSTAVWLGASVGLFLIGWVIQLIGHYFEGKKPAFLDDMVGLLIGPLFVVAEAGFALGLRHPVRAAIEAKVGPTLIRRSPAAAAA